VAEGITYFKPVSSQITISSVVLVLTITFFGLVSSVVGMFFVVKATPMTMQQLIVITLRKRVQNTELTIPMMGIQERKINPTPLHQQHIQYGSAQSVENRLKLM
jgi:hypothetical protein